MRDILFGAWPWYVSGPLIGLIVPALMWAGGRPFGLSSNFRHLCAAVLPTRLAFFRYDWRAVGGWNLLVAVGMVAGGFLGSMGAGADLTVDISAATRADLTRLGLTDFSGLVPAELFSWHSLTTGPGILVVVLGGFLVGFGARYAGGCTSGHGITGLANLQKASLVAVLAFFAGGLAMTYFLLPVVLKGLGG